MSVVNAILVNVAVAMEGDKSALAAAGMAGLAAQTGGVMAANPIAIFVLVHGLVTMEEGAVAVIRSKSVVEQLTLPVTQRKLVTDSYGAQREIRACIALHMVEVETLVT